MRIVLTLKEGIVTSVELPPSQAYRLYQELAQKMIKELPPKGNEITISNSTSKEFETPRSIEKSIDKIYSEGKLK